MRDVALEVPLGALALGRLGQRDDTRHARVEVHGHAPDGAALAGPVPSLEDHDQAGAAVLHPALALRQLDLQAVELGLVIRFLQPSVVGVAVVENVPLLALLDGLADRGGGFFLEIAADAAVEWQVAGHGPCPPLSVLTLARIRCWRGMGPV
jgi:hypothetical protein